MHFKQINPLTQKETVYYSQSKIYIKWPVSLNLHGTVVPQLSYISLTDFRISPPPVVLAQNPG